MCRTDKDKVQKIERQEKTTLISNGYAFGIVIHNINILHRGWYMKGFFQMFFHLQMKNDDDEEFFSNYFKSHCHPKCPDITVQQIEQKKTNFLAQVAVKFGLEDVDPQSRTVKEVVKTTPHQLHCSPDPAIQSDCMCN